MRRVSAILLCLAGLLLAGLPTAAGQAPAPNVTGTPMLGRSSLTPEQIAAWYASIGKLSRSHTPVAEIARLMVDEGDAQGVRGDIAFAQSMLETGWLSFGGQVQPADNNFSGLGACDECPRGLAFPSAELGVRAQIQHLFAYASPTADPNGLARPLADNRFTGVRPYGRAQTWEQMGGGNWATDPAYSGKVLAIWRQMLTYSGVAVPTPAAPPAVAPSPLPALPLEIRVNRAGARLGTWVMRRHTLADAVRLLGSPTSTRAAGATCLVRWPALGAALQFGGSPDPCDPVAATGRWAYLSSRAWRTTDGLAVGDNLARLKFLYPTARLRNGRWWLVQARTAGRRAPMPRLRAVVRHRRVRGIWVNVSR